MAARWYHQISWLSVNERYTLQCHLFPLFLPQILSFFLLLLAEVSINWQDPSISFLGWQHSIVPMLLIKSDCRDMFTFLFSWVDLIDCNGLYLCTILNPHTTAGKTDYCNKACLLFNISSIIKENTLSLFCIFPCSVPRCSLYLNSLVIPANRILYQNIVAQQPF